MPSHCTQIYFSLKHVCTPPLINHCHWCLWQKGYRRVCDSGSPLLPPLLRNKIIPPIWFTVSQQHTHTHTYNTLLKSQPHPHLWSEAWSQTTAFTSSPCDKIPVWTTVGCDVNVTVLITLGLLLSFGQKLHRVDSIDWGLSVFLRTYYSFPGKCESNYAEHVVYSHFVPFSKIK